MSLLYLPRGNLKVAEDSYMRVMERNEKKKNKIQKVKHLKEKIKLAKVNSITHLVNRIARESISDSLEEVKKKYASNEEMLC